MKIFTVCFICLIYCCMISSAQIGDPSRINTSGKKNVDPARLEVVRPADLQVTELRLLSLRYEVVTIPRGDVGSGRYVIARVSVSIKNFGGLSAPGSRMVAELKGGAVGSTWTVPQGRVEVSTVNPGQSLSTEYSFYIPSTLMEKGVVQFRVKADFSNAVRESNETNNYSAIISLDPATIER